MSRLRFFLIFALLLSGASIVSAQPASRFSQLFRLPGVEFSEAQAEQLKKIADKHEQALSDLVRKQQEIYTPEQRRAQRDALQAARDAGKDRREAEAAIAAAVKLTDDQQKQLADLRDARQKQLEEIRGELIQLLTPEQRKQWEERFGPRRPGDNVRPTHPNEQYGEHRRQVMDIWLAESDHPTPLLISIHGGGFRGGNKSVSPELRKLCLDHGISVAAITYRLSDEAIAPAQFLDAARAVQYLRHHAKEWNLDPERFAATGGSAGAGLSLWLGFHKDLARPDADDPVLREPTRLTCMSVFNGQTSYDPRFIRKLFPDTDTYLHPALAQLYDVDLSQLDDLPAEKYKLFEEVSALPHLSADDPPAQLIYRGELDDAITNQGVGIHHPRFATALEEQMRPLKIECEIHTGVRGTDDSAKLTFDFIQRHFAAEKN